MGSERPPRPQRRPVEQRQRVPGRLERPMKRAQKRAIVGAVNDATAAGGIFTDREEDDSTPPPQNDGLAWYEQALEEAVRLHHARSRTRTVRRGQDRLREGAAVAPEGPHPEHRQEARRAAEEGHPGRRGGPRQQRPQVRSRKEEAPADDQPGSITAAQLTKLHTVLTGLGFGGEDREQKLVIAEVITGHDPLTGPKKAAPARTCPSTRHACSSTPSTGWTATRSSRSWPNTRTAYGRRPAMTDDPLVREIGRITDDAGRTVIIGVDHATVTCGRSQPEPRRGGARRGGPGGTRPDAHRRRLRTAGWQRRQIDADTGALASAAGAP